MRTSQNTRTRALRAATLIVGVAAAAGAQLPNANPAATGLSDAYLARARGYDAVAWNPANLAMPGNPSFSIGLLALHAASGLDPISLSDFAPYSGKVLPAAEREAWMQKITANGGEHGSMNGGVTFLGLSAGPIALQVASSVGVSANFSPDAAEAALFGNAGRTPSVVKDLSLNGSHMHAAGFTTGALSFGHSLGTNPVTGGRLSIGATAKYISGNFVGIAQDNGSTTTSNNVNVNFPVVYSHPDSSLTPGSGYGLDLGMSWNRSKLTVGATVQNVFNTFAWDENKLYSKKGLATFNTTENTSDFDDQPYTSAPAELREQVKNDKFKPIVGAGVAYAMHRTLILSADARQQLGDGIQLGPKTEVGGGVEYRGIPFLRLRGGASIITDGWGVSGGAGLAFFGYELGVGAALRTVNSGKEPVVTVNLLSIK